MESRKMEIEESLSELKESFKTGKTKSVSWRKKQLKAILQLITDNQHNIFKALHQDLGKSIHEAYRDEVGIVERSATHALNCVEKWMSPIKSHLPLLFFPMSGEVRPEPLGTVLIFSSWNCPFSLAMDPLIGAISAGNTAVIKPSELSPACSSFLAHTIPLYLDTTSIKVIQGTTQIASLLLQQKWDKIFFTGSARVGRIVMTEAAKNLTPVILELGGKCPTIVDTLDNFRDMKVAVKRIIAGKWGTCNGQVCIGIDYVLVEEKFASTLIELLKKTIKIMYGENNSKFLSKIVNKQHFKRLQNLIENPKVAASIVQGGTFDEENLFIEPTILLDPPLDSELMTDEIFGPILPIITLSKIDESIEFINSRPKPLAIYAFTKNETFKQRILSETSSGSVTFNDVIIQFICETLPFGGVGESGMGRYHGKYSFDSFSHEKAVVEGSYVVDFGARYPPWNDFKLKFMTLGYSSQYFKLLLHMLGKR